MVDELRRLNHWVPTSYLAAFTATGRTDGVLTVYDRENPGRVFPTGPRAVAHERDLYVITGPDGQPTDVLERMLAEVVEAPFISVRNALTYGSECGILSILTRDQVSSLAIFLAFQQLRTPNARAMAQRLLRFGGAFVARAGILDTGMRESYRRETGREITDEQARGILEAIDQGRITMQLDPKAWLGFWGHAIGELAQLISEQPFVVLQAPDGVEFATCDEPLVMATRRQDGTYHPGGGWLRPDTEITFPLTPHHLLVIGAAAVGPYVDHSREWLTGAADRIVAHARRWVFARAPNERIPEVLASTRAPRHVVSYPGGLYGEHDDPVVAVRDMMSKNRGSAVVVFGESPEPWGLPAGPP